MKKLACIILFIVGFTSAEKVTTQQKPNPTKEESNINKRYAINIPQISPLFYSNNQALPTQQLFLSNPAFAYYNSLQARPTLYPQYYILPGNNYIQTYPSSPSILQQPAPQQVVPQQVVPQQVVPQGLAPQQIIPQQIITQQVVPQQITTQQQIAQQIIPQQLPQKLPQQLVPQQIFSQLPQSNIFAQQQRVPYEIIRGLEVPAQNLFQAPKPQVLVKNEPYPYEVPPSQHRIPEKQVPVLNKPNVLSVNPYLYGAPQYQTPNVLQNSVYNSQPQTVLINSNLLSNGGNPQVVRIGYGHPQLNQEEVQTATNQQYQPQQPQYQPQTVHVDSSLYRTYEGQQPVVRIGYGTHPLQNTVFQQQQYNSPQQLKLPLTYNLQRYANNNQQNEADIYKYENSANRLSRSPEKYSPKEKPVVV